VRQFNYLMKLRNSQISDVLKIENRLPSTFSRCRFLVLFVPISCCLSRWRMLVLPHFFSFLSNKGIQISLTNVHTINIFCIILDISQWTKPPIFDNMALYFECRINKSVLLQTAFLVIFPTGKL